MKHYMKGNSYLTQIEKTNNSKINTYRCEICLSEIDLYEYRVTTKHTKTCGCISGKRPLEVEITKEGYVISKGNYEVSSKMAKGYKGFKKEYLHRLVALKFIPNPHGFTDVNHIDGNKANNHIDNLEWCSRSDNILHAYQNNLNYTPSKISTRRKLSQKDVEEIRQSTLSSLVLAQKYDVSKPTILNIKNHKIYNQWN